MDVVVVGAGLMGSQIAASTRSPAPCTAWRAIPTPARARVDAALATVVRLGLHDEASAQAAASRLSAGDALAGVEGCELVVESVPGTSRSRARCSRRSRRTSEKP
jgi:3-hydroxyacyl-CoA dehydrogenase